MSPFNKCLTPSATRTLTPNCPTTAPLHQSAVAHRHKKKRHHEESTALVIPLLPAEAPLPDAEEEVPLETFHCVMTAVNEAESFEDGSLVSVEEDTVLGKDAVQLEGSHGKKHTRYV